MVDDDKNQQFHQRYEAFMEKQREERDRYLGALGFDWCASPRQDHGEIAINPLGSPQGLSVTLLDGRVIALREWHQYAVYEGTLCGVPPDPEDNLIAALKAAQRIFPSCGDRPVMLEPCIHTATFETSPKKKPFPYPLVWLPKVCTIARFESAAPARESAHVYSSLVVVWFQDDYGLPNDRHAFEQLRRLDWLANATDYTP